MVANFLGATVVAMGVTEVDETLGDVVVAVSCEMEVEVGVEVAPPHAASNAHAKTKALRRMRSE